MRSRQLIFFTTRADITALMGAFEKEIKYARLGSSDNENISYCESLSNYPDVGYTDFEDWISLDNRFLIIPKSDEVKTRTVKLHDGQVRYITDLMQNPTGVELSTGGVCLKKDNVLVAGRIAAFESSEKAVLLYKKIQRAVRRDFTKVNAVYVSSEAMDLLKNGWRLTYGVNSPLYLQP